MIVGLYGDESTDKEITSVGAVIGWPVWLYYAETDWQARLQRDGIAYYRTSDCENLSGPFDPQVRGWSLNAASDIAKAVKSDLVDILRRKEGIGAVGVSIEHATFDHAITNPRTRAFWGDDRLIAAYKALICAVIKLIDEDWPGSSDLPIAFIFDEHSNWEKAEEAYRQLKRLEPCAPRMGHVGHDDDKMFPPLQMADLIASETRRFTIQHLANRSERTPAFIRLNETHTVWFLAIADKKYLHEMAERFGA